MLDTNHRYCAKGAGLDFANNFIFVGGLLLALSILAGILSVRSGVPILLVFLGIGMLFGEAGPGQISFYNIELSYLICSAALAVILFDGGVHTKMRQFQIGLRPAASLATLGVVLTAILVALPLMVFFNIAFLPAFLIGATVASTDAAAVFMMLHQQKIKLRGRLLATLETESGLNDPMAVFLTIGIVQLMLTGNDHSGLALLGFFLQQMGIGAATGYAGGKLMGASFQRLTLPSGLYPILGLSGALMIFGGTALLDGSGFLAVYIAGLVAGSHMHKGQRVLSAFMDGMAWLSQMVMLLILGLLVMPHHLLLDLPVALLAAVTLIFFARPLAVFISLLGSRHKLREKLFVSWVGLRGAVPIYLALIPALMGVPGGETYFNIAFIIVLLSLILQGGTIRPAARLLGLDRTVAKAEK